ncbi:hypothetical protein [Bartonella taylorii]|nr:hypothetical protein [Bartonella taylorii]
MTDNLQSVVGLSSSIKEPLPTTRHSGPDSEVVTARVSSLHG